MNTTAASADTTDDTDDDDIDDDDTDDTTDDGTTVPKKVVSFLKLFAEEGETYKGYTLLDTEYIPQSCGLDCCGYAQIILRIRTPDGEVVEVG